MAKSVDPPDPTREYISYADFVGDEPVAPGEDVFLHGATNAAGYRAVGALSDSEFSGSGDRTGALVLARLRAPVIELDMY
jgi:hypothetical protein